MPGKNPNNRPCLFTYNNQSLKEFNKSNREGFELTTAGELIMWKRLDDGLRKTLRLSRRQISKIQTEQNRHNQSSENYE